MRSVAEIRFRARQEFENIWLRARPPRVRDGPRTLALPDADAICEALKGTPAASRIEAVAQEVLQHRFELFGTQIETGSEVQWRRDYVNARETAAVYFRRLPYLDFAAVGDHKYIWELNRLQHLVVLAQANRLNPNSAYIRELERLLKSWVEQNPYQRGINWASALEVGFRAMSLIWIFHLAADCLTGGVRELLLGEIYRHGRHLAANLSVYFSPNTHLLGEAVALHAIAVLFPSFPESGGWRQLAARIVEGQLTFQVHTDGSHFEQSTYYHVYALDLFLFHYILAGRPSAFEPVLERMAEYLAALLGPMRRMAFFGDDDGGRMFFPYGSRDRFGRATLASCGVVLGRKDWVGDQEDLSEQAVWWLGAVAARYGRSQPWANHHSRLFSDAGMAFLSAGDLRVQFDAGRFGWGGAGHSHADTLSLVLSYDGEWVFRDPGTYTYVADEMKRNSFRGTRAHNTVTIDRLDQADAQGPFRWVNKPECSLIDWSPTNEGGSVEAMCAYRVFSHTRQVQLSGNAVLVVDHIQGRDEHLCEQRWQLGPAAARVDLAFSEPVQHERSEYSPAYGATVPAWSVTAAFKGPLPATMAMHISVPGSGKVLFDPSLREVAVKRTSHSPIE